MCLVTKNPRGLAHGIELLTGLSVTGYKFMRGSVLLSRNRDHFVLLDKINYSWPSVMIVEPSHVLSDKG